MLCLSFCPRVSLPVCFCPFLSVSLFLSVSPLPPNLAQHLHVNVNVNACVWVCVGVGVGVCVSVRACGWVGGKAEIPDAIAT